MICQKHPHLGTVITQRCVVFYSKICFSQRCWKPSTHTQHCTTLHTHIHTRTLIPSKLAVYKKITNSYDGYETHNMPDISNKSMRHYISPTSNIIKIPSIINIIIIIWYLASTQSSSPFLHHKGTTYVSPDCSKWWRLSSEMRLMTQTL